MKWLMLDYYRNYNKYNTILLQQNKKYAIQTNWITNRTQSNKVLHNIFQHYKIWRMLVC